VADELVLLVAGFVLTSVLGGLLGSYFQTRAWRHRYAAERRDERQRQAIRTFEEVSTLLDRRLYRMRRVWWSVKLSVEQGSRARDLESALEEYRRILFDWNDNLNRLLALVQTYFGAGIRQLLEEVVFEEFASIGRALDYGVRRVSSSSEAADDVPRVGQRLTDLSNRVYRLNVRMLELFEKGLVGGEAPTSLVDEESPARLAFGARGRTVQDLQHALVRHGYAVTPDGSFGRDTHLAVLSFQRDNGLAADGVVGAGTLRVLG
jgi:hypothetical protein